jgi:hypothetical protein
MHGPLNVKIESALVEGFAVRMPVCFGNDVLFITVNPLVTLMLQFQLQDRGVLNVQFP